MSLKFPLNLLAPLLFCLAFLSGAANAAEAGSNARIITPTQTLSGPGPHYPETLSYLEQGETVLIGRCTNRWCRIAGTDDWISMDNLSFGQTPDGPFSGPKFIAGKGGDGQVCLYSGENYSGTVLCLPSGAVSRDLSLLGIDDTIASVSIEGDVSVNLCRDPGFASLCERIDLSTPRLSRLLVRAVSSFQVY